MHQKPVRVVKAKGMMKKKKAVQEQPAVTIPFTPRPTPAPYQQWGEGLDHESIQQMDNACALPISVRGALMPDAHIGYGLPIGGVLAVRNAVIPYAVGVDIACRMKMSVLDLPVQALLGQRERLKKVLERETKFGVGATFRDRREHDVLDAEWNFSQFVGSLKDKAWSQLGTSGSGNHFVEYGILTVRDTAVGLPEGDYLAILSHSGSRGSGATIADHFSKLAMSLHPELPKHLRHLAWLDLNSQEGQEYWQAMQLMGQYAAANHACIHRHMAKALGAKVLLDVENHHNFAWREEHDGEQLIVHRKGATPAGEGVTGIIPGTMADPAFIVRGKGNPLSLNSAAHGAGRRMSRKAAKEKFTWSEIKRYLKANGVELLTAGLDEAPMAYKNIHEVMAAQKDLVHIMAQFDPKIVKMAPAGERPED
jgi:tRNA-splicing ligase RtcB (3'-phosphate/5'-hydroxy nucleic acid ligase)